MTPEQERWAEAALVQRIYGGDAPLHVAIRLGALASAGDMAGVRRWREIAFRLDRLRRGGGLTTAKASGSTVG